MGSLWCLKNALKNHSFYNHSWTKVRNIENRSWKTPCAKFESGPSLGASLSRPFPIAKFLSCHSRKSRALTNNINGGCIPFWMFQFHDQSLMLLVTPVKRCYAMIVCYEKVAPTLFVQYNVIVWTWPFNALLRTSYCLTSWFDNYSIMLKCHHFYISMLNI